jgi:bromodomain-containing factor 1
LADLPLQPVQELPATTSAQSDFVNHPSDMDDAPLHNGDASDTLPHINGGSSAEMNGHLNSPPSSSLLQMEGTTTATSVPASSSTVPASSSFDSFAPSTTHIETQNTVTTATPQEHLQSLAEWQPTPEQAPTSNMRSSPQPLPQDSETALRIKNEKHQQDLAKDSELAQALAADGEGLIARTTTEEEPAVESTIQTSLDFSTQQTPMITNAPFPSPPPAPKPTHATLPVDQPEQPAPTPAAPDTSNHLRVDQPMIDAPPSPGKISRERDEEGEEQGPAAKRLKAEDDVAEPEFKVPQAPAHSPPADQRETEQPTAADDIITPARLAHMKKVIANLKKSSISSNFREPVNVVALNIPSYLEIIKQPMDVGTVDRKLKSSTYKTVSEFVTDFNLIVNNTITFNGTSHTVTVAGLKMRQSFENQMKALPPAHFAVPAREEKKPTKAKEHPVRTASQRRPSIPQAPAPGTARSPATPGAATTFALGPEGMPLIRRDSTAADGRPKRAIHPPKRRDHEFGAGRPRKKKFEWQLKFCKEVITEMKKPKYYPFAQYFYVPVDPVALNIPSYHKIVKKPMDMDTVERKLDTYQYEKARDFEEDVRQIFKNCYLFNQPGDFVYTAGQQLEKLFEEKWATKDEWLASHEPASEPQSPGDEDEEDDASEEEEDDSADERTDEIAQLKAQIAMMSQTIGNLQSGPKKKKKTTPPAPAAAKKSGKPKKKDKPASFPGLQQTAKDKKKSLSKSKPDKEHFVTYNEKQYISTGISSLPDARMSEALKIIQSNVPSLKNTHETEIELDIDELPNHVLLKLLNFVKRYGENAPPEPEPPQQPAYTPTVSAPGKPKKNKPMSKQEQEQQIRELKGKLGVYDGSQISPDPSKCIEMFVNLN